MGYPIHPFPFSKQPNHNNDNNNNNNNNTGVDEDTKPNPGVDPMGWPGCISTSNKPPEDHVQKPMLRAPKPTLSLVEPERRRRPSRPNWAVRLFRSLCQTFPVFTTKCSSVPAPCKMLSNTHISSSDFRHPSMAHTVSPTIRITGTLFGYRKGRVSFAFQQNSRCLPTVVIELAIQTHTLLREMGSGLVRIALECEKHIERGREELTLLEEPLWTMFCNGKKCGYGVRREATEEDLAVMETLSPVSMGAGVLPGRSETEGPNAELAYVRAFFEHVIGSRDSETLYMISPDGRNGPELTIFFVRI